MKPSEVLIQAKERIKDPKCWTKRRYGFNAASPESDCAIGACRAITTGNNSDRAIDYLYADAAMYGFVSAMAANDDPNTTHKQVMRALDRAIQAAKKNGE